MDDTCFRPQVEVLEDRTLLAAEFQILELLAVDYTVVDNEPHTGDERAGIALSSAHAFYTGDVQTGRFALNNLSGGTGLGQRYDALVSDLATQTVYALGTSAVTPLTADAISNAGIDVTHLLEIGGFSGQLTGNSVSLLSPITITPGIGGFPDIGLFAGYGRVVLHTHDGAIFSINPMTGSVANLGVQAIPTHQTCDEIGYWGVAEKFGGDDYLTYVQDSRAVVRQKVADGSITTLRTFTNLARMCAFTASPSNNRWYFHHDGVSEFGGTTLQNEVLGFAPASFAITLDQPPVIVLGGSQNTETDALNQHFTWSVTDANDDVTALSVTITKNGGSFQTFHSASGAFDFNADGAGEFAILVTATDSGGAAVFASRSVAVSDDDVSAPATEFSNALDQTDADDNIVGWSISDASDLFSRSVRLFAVGSQTSIFANSTSNADSFNLNGFAPGQYGVEAVAVDNDFDDGRTADRTASSAVRTFTMSDDDPDAPAIIFSNAVDQTDADNNLVGWTISDASGLSSTLVRLFATGIPTPLFTNASETAGTFDLNSLPPGEYRIEATATDADSDDDRPEDRLTQTLGQTFTISLRKAADAVQFAVNAYLGYESTGQAIIGLERNGEDGGPFSVRLSATDVTATKGADYLDPGQIVQFAAGENSKTIVISILEDHRVCELLEVFRLIISDPTNGITLGALDQTVVTIQESQQLPTLNECFVAQAYEDLLNRGGELAGIAYWTTRLQVIDRRRMILEMQQSPEYQRLVANQLSQQYMNRPARPSELRSAQRYLENGGSQKGLATTTAASQDYFERIGGGTNDGFLSVFFPDAVARPIHEPELQSYRSLMTVSQPPMTREQVAEDIFGGEEFMTRLVSGHYERFLRRTAEPGGVDFYLHRLRAGDSYELVIASFLGSPEYYEQVGR